MDVAHCNIGSPMGKFRMLPIITSARESVKYLWSQVAADGGCERYVVHRINEVCRAWGTLKSVPNNKGLGLKAKKCI